MEGAVQDGPADKWLKIAQKHWLSASKVKVTPAVLKQDIWDPLEAESFALQTLTILESLQILEKFLWPGYTDGASNQHVILIAIFVAVKQRARLQDWGLFADRSEDFSLLFRRVLSLNLDQSLPMSVRLTVLSFVSTAFQSLEKDFIRKECAPLVSISIWHNLHKVGARERLLDSRSGLRKAWRAAQKRFEVADEATQRRLQFDRAWLYAMLLDAIGRFEKQDVVETEEITYCEKFVEFITDLLSQLPTRRYTRALLMDLNILPVLHTSSLCKHDKSAQLRRHLSLLQHFLSRGKGENEEASSIAESEQYKIFSRLQRVALKKFPEKLKVLGLSNFASASSVSDLRSHLSPLSESELQALCDALDVRRTYPANMIKRTEREILLDSICYIYARQATTTDTAHSPIMPTNEALYREDLLQNEMYDGVRPLAIPKLNLQYLDLNDFFWRSFLLHRAEAFYEIRKDIESTIKRMKPRPGRELSTVTFDGFSKMALPIAKPAIIEVGQPKIGDDIPSFVRAEVILDVKRLNEGLRHEWDGLRPFDVVFLASVRPKPASKAMTNGHQVPRVDENYETDRIRSAEVVQILDDNGRPLRDYQHNQANGYGPRPQSRRILLNLDPKAYKSDMKLVSRGKPDAYSSINVIVRRSRRENNFKPILETLQKLLDTNASLPTWLQDVFLGYGNPREASYPATATGVDTTIDFLDTFLDRIHLSDSFANQTLSAHSSSTLPDNPPYVVKFPQDGDPEVPSNPKKRRRAQIDDSSLQSSSIEISTYVPPNTGPYPTDKPPINSIRFTPKQVEALTSGVFPGLTVIVGPPGTGKTDVAAQLIHLLISNYPHERILLVAHSNQALNQLFQKITALNIDPRHLLRLGHGEEDLETEESYSKAGRVESFLENRQIYLSEVDRLAKSLGAEGAHGSTCETAEYFKQVYIEPAWNKFWARFEGEAATPDSVRKSFPFTRYFSNAPIPALFPPESTLTEMKGIANGCHRHIDNIFTELATVRPFEILRNARDQQNHLLVKEARVIAMTSTHAAMRRSEIATLGFHYDTLIMEEAAQITEIESFIPCAMQNPDSETGELPLKRIVLVGDHLQNSPVVQNMGLKQYANYEQSMFQRLVRLGVPTINLDQQGRCRPSLADLFRWRYNNLGDLPHVHQSPEFAFANAGFRHESQFIDVPDYQGQGEREPTPHFIQNLGEAEYAVALYQYMRLLGYPARSISILTTYAGQRALIRDVLDHRCKGNRLFGLPRIVSTVDKYQGEQNDYIIVSMTRTRSIGYLRDVRRLTVLLSRARLGLYILGKRELFETACLEMKPAMEILAQRPDKLSLVIGEMFPTRRRLEDQVVSTEMDGVEHLGQYVFEMTQAKVRALGGHVQMTQTEIEQEGYADVEGADGEAIVGGEADEDPLHEAV